MCSFCPLWGDILWEKMWIEIRTKQTGYLTAHRLSGAVLKMMINDVFKSRLSEVILVDTHIFIVMFCTIISTLFFIIWFFIFQMTSTLLLTIDAVINLNSRSIYVIYVHMIFSSSIVDRPCIIGTKRSSIVVCIIMNNYLVIAKLKMK